jgi:hypothetical protein
MARRFPPPWRAHKIPGGMSSGCQWTSARLDLLEGQRTRSDTGQGADKDEARRLVVNVARLPGLLEREIATQPDPRSASHRRGPILDDRRRDIAAVGMPVVTGDHNDNSRKHEDCEPVRLLGWGADQAFSTSPSARRSALMHSSPSRRCRSAARAAAGARTGASGRH